MSNYTEYPEQLETSEDWTGFYSKVLIDCGVKRKNPLDPQGWTITDKGLRLTWTVYGDNYSNSRTYVIDRPLSDFTIEEVRTVMERNGERTGSAWRGIVQTETKWRSANGGGIKSGPKRGTKTWDKAMAKAVQVPGFTFTPAETELATAA